MCLLFHVSNCTIYFIYCHNGCKAESVGFFLDAVNVEAIDDNTRMYGEAVSFVLLCAFSADSQQRKEKNCASFCR